MKDRCKIAFRIVYVFVDFMAIQSIHAFHGIWLPAFGADQAGLGGAFYSRYGSVLVLEENPALLSRVEGHTVQGAVSINNAMIQYEDRYFDSQTGTVFSNDREFSPVAVLPAAGYAYGNDQWSAGIAVYVQGGGGADFQNLLRPFPATEANAENVTSNNQLTQATGLATENLQARFALVKLTPGFSYSIGRFHIGIGLDLVYSQKKLDRSYRELATGLTLPGGFEYRSDPVFAAGGKLGILYEDGPIAFSFAAISMSRFYLNGQLQPDSYDLLQLQPAKVSRFMEWPARLVAGFEYMFHNEIRLVADISYTYWSQSMNSLLFTIDRPAVLTPVGVRSPYFRMNLKWRDQIVMSAGIEKYWNNTVIRAGVSYGPTVQSEQGLNPLLGTNMEYHLTAGFGWLLDSGNEKNNRDSFDVALQYSLPKKVNGAVLSDWWLSRAIQTNPFRIALFQYNKTTAVVSLYIGYTARFGRSK